VVRVGKGCLRQVPVGCGLRGGGGCVGKGQATRVGYLQNFVTFVLKFCKQIKLKFFYIPISVKHLLNKIFSFKILKKIFKKK
jgi:hypothetical protein